MKHEIHRLQPVLIRNRCVEHILQTVRGIQAFSVRPADRGIRQRRRGRASIADAGERGLDVSKQMTKRTERLAEAILADRNRPSAERTDIAKCFMCGTGMMYRGSRFCSPRCRDFYDDPACPATIMTGAGQSLAR